MYLISCDAQAVQLLRSLLSRRLRGKSAYNCLHKISPLSWFQEICVEHTRSTSYDAYPTVVLARAALGCSSMLQQLPCQEEKFSIKRHAKKEVRAWRGWLPRLYVPRSAPDPIPGRRVEHRRDQVASS